MQLILLAAVATVSTVDVSVNKACVKDVLASVSEISVTAEQIRGVATTCKNGTQADCLAGVQKASTDCASLVAQGTKTAKACDNKISDACTSDIDSVATSLSQAANSITAAVGDCKNDTQTGNCIMDILDAATYLGEGGLEIYHATVSCKAGAASNTTCVPDTLATIDKARSAAHDIKAAVKACRTKKGCSDAVLTAINSVGETAQYSEAAGEACGTIKAGGCVADITDAVSFLLESAGDIKKAEPHCKSGLFHMECLKALEGVASDVAHAVMDVVKATSACRKL
eukprot:TRINITY_DN2721_c0_g1_i1.p2 TRINITY_DN2721_c0_g1~~TRINITY_DN2721_c0_g1_i1.p2  ORF type:complete len:285 (+),score=138.67 TRINITY_DN2721_c0_g1_i1:79-933(+)